MYLKIILRENTYLRYFNLYILTYRGFFITSTIILHLMVDCVVRSIGLFCFSSFELFLYEIENLN